jgi:hypothetical protein
MAKTLENQGFSRVFRLIFLWLGKKDLKLQRSECFQWFFGF